MSKGKKIFEIIALCLFALVILYTVFLWKYVLPYLETDEPDEPGTPAESVTPETPADDVLLFFRGAPAIVFAVAAVWLFLKWRKERALDLLRHMERKNSGLQNEMPMCIFFTAPPRTGKTTMISAMALTLSAEFRRAALELMEKNALRFPRFPWINLEKDLQDAIVGHRRCAGEISGTPGEPLRISGPAAGAGSRHAG